jgi:hypothetical protein
VAQTQPARASSCDTRNVPTRGLTAVDVRVLWFVLIFAVPGLFIVLFLTVGGPTHNLLPKLALWAGLLFLIWAIMEGSISVRRVEVTESGVLVSYLFDRRRSAWTELAPSQQLARRGLWVLYSGPPTASTGRSRRYFVTVEQARAILSHPARPGDWVLAPAIRESLGLALAP